MTEATTTARKPIDGILKAAHALPSLKGITLTSQDPMAQARWLTALGDLQKAVAAYDAAPASPSAARPLEFGYTNYRGEFSQRRTQPIRFYFGSTEWHPEPQWLMEATDLGKGEVRAFAVKDMVFGAHPAQPDAEERGVTETATVTSLAELIDAMVRYGEDVEGDAPWEHREMMRRARSALSAARASAPAAPQVVGILRDMTALFEMTDEAQQPGTDSYTVLWRAREFLRSAGEGK